MQAHSCLYSVWSMDTHICLNLCDPFCEGVTYYIAAGPRGHDTLHTLHMDKISSDNTYGDRCLYPYSIQNINGLYLKKLTIT